MKRKTLVSVIGGHKCDAKTAELAYQIGRIVALEDCVLVTGGLGGIMKHASHGAKEAGGITLGIIPGDDKTDANEYVDIVIASGFGYSRNTLVVGAADLVVALPGEYGTLSEIGFALNGKKKVVGFGTWDIKGVKKLKRPEHLVKAIREVRRVS